MDMNRYTNYVPLPAEVSNEIMQQTQEGSAIMRLARKISLPGTGVTIPVITSDPTAGWVAETGVKPVSTPGVNKKTMQAYKLAVIEMFSEEFVRDLKALYDSLIARLPGVLAAKFDATILGAAEAPGENFDTFASCHKQSLVATTGHSTYDGLVAADTDISVAGGLLNGFALGAQARGILLGAVDSTGRPIFVNSVSEGAIERILGQPTYFNRGIYEEGTAPSGTGTTYMEGVPEIVGIAGDWTKAMYGTVEGVKIKVSDSATIASGSGTSATSTSLWQQNMIAVMAEIELGFRADTNCFNLLTGVIPGN